MCYMCGYVNVCRVIEWSINYRAIAFFPAGIQFDVSDVAALWDGVIILQFVWGVNILCEHVARGCVSCICAIGCEVKLSEMLLLS